MAGFFYARPVGLLFFGYFVGDCSLVAVTMLVCRAVRQVDDEPVFFPQFCHGMSAEHEFDKECSAAVAYFGSVDVCETECVSDFVGTDVGEYVDPFVI